MSSSLPGSAARRGAGNPASRRCCASHAAGDAPSWAAEHRDALRAIVAEHGSVLVRGLGLRDAAEVGAVFRQLAGTGLMTEREAFASRQATRRGVYSSSKWPPNQPMCMHHELSYALEFPGLMMFACLTAPTSGGATAVADSPAVLDALPAELVERFEREGWLLTRSYNDEIGASVAEAFGTDDRAAVESYCRANGDRVRVAARRWAAHPAAPQRRGASPGHRPALLVQPDRLPQRVDDRPRRCASTWSTSTASDGLPFNTRFGNGDPIGEDVVQLLNERLRGQHRRASRGRPATCCWSTTSAPRTAGSPSRARARCWSRWPTRCDSPTRSPTRCRDERSTHDRESRRCRRSR